MTYLLTKPLVQSLPEKINLTGFAINRMVFIDGVNVEPKARETLDSPYLWGCKGPKASQLGRDILHKYFGPDVTENVLEAFMYSVLVGIKETNFSRDILLQEFFTRLMDGDTKPYEGTVLEVPLPEFEEIMRSNILLMGQPAPDKAPTILNRPEITGHIEIEKDPPSHD